MVHGYEFQNMAHNDVVVDQMKQLTAERDALKKELEQWKGDWPTGDYYQVVQEHNELKEALEEANKLLDSGMILFTHPENQWGNTKTLHKGISLRDCIQSAMKNEKGME